MEEYGNKESLEKLHVNQRCIIFFSSRNNGCEFGGSIYQKVNEQLETAVNLAWAAGSNGTRFGIAAKYQIDSCASISVSPLNAYCITREIMICFQHIFGVFNMNT